MKNQKRNLIISTTLRRAGWSAGIAIAVGVGVELLVYLLGLIMNQNIESLVAGSREDAVRCH